MGGSTNQRTQAQAELEAAVADLEQIMFAGGQNIDTCKFCVTEDCYARGGHRLCDPKWRGQKQEGKTMNETMYNTEQAVHEEAERLRSMSDKQLVEEFHRAAVPEAPSDRPDVPQDGAEAAGATGDTSAVEKLLTALAEGKCKGIKSGFAYKVAQLAEEMGLV